MDRRDFIKGTFVVTAGMAIGLPLRAEANPEFDLVIRGGMILDGTGGPAWKADIGIKADTIAAFGEIPGEHGRAFVDINGMHIAPGFIDIHSHSDDSVIAYPTADSRIRQGITTEITGNCGSSAAPIAGNNLAEYQKYFQEEYGYDLQWKDVASYFAFVEKTTISLNHALLLGQGTIRSNVIGEVDRKVTTTELTEILRQVEDGMEHGAIGVSTGLEYTPGIYTPTEELIEMVRIVARRGGLYASHIRNEEAYLLEAVDEAINIGRRTGSRVQISHLKAAGRANWNRQRAAINLIESARRDGVEVFADAYPYTAYSTGLTVILESWVRDGGSTKILERIKDPATREKIRKEVDHRITTNDPGGYDLIVISNVQSGKNKNCIGKNLLQIAEMWKVEPVDAYLRLLEEENASVGYVGHGMSPENVEMVLSHPLVMVSSDGYSIAPSGKALESKPHPRSYGTYPRFLGYYTRERKIVDLPSAIRKMTSMPASQCGLKDRGRIAKGHKADMVVFDPSAIKEVSTFDDPHRFPLGISHVFVNGVQVVKDGNHTGARPGRILRS